MHFVAILLFGVDDVASCNRHLQIYTIYSSTLYIKGDDGFWSIDSIY